MKLTIHDVGHGLCVSLLHENNNTMVWDCGQADWHRPSEVLYSNNIRTISRLFITNFDEDHVSDLPQFRSLFKIPILFRNRSISAEQLTALKNESGTLTTAMESMTKMMGSYNSEITSEPQFPNVSFCTFYNKYGVDFNDTNNISLVTFLDIGTTRFIIPGDLESAGWKKLLNNKSFTEKLSKVSVFIASHHGRENGYCADVFTHCTPDVIVFSDGPIAYDTQDMTQTYQQHARGIQFEGETRYVLTTRNDGSLTWSI